MDQIDLDSDHAAPEPRPPRRWPALRVLTWVAAGLMLLLVATSISSRYWALMYLSKPKLTPNGFWARMYTLADGQISRQEVTTWAPAQRWYVQSRFSSGFAIPIMSWRGYRAFPLSAPIALLALATLVLWTVNRYWRLWHPAPGYRAVSRKRLPLPVSVGAAAVVYILSFVVVNPMLMLAIEAIWPGDSVKGMRLYFGVSENTVLGVMLFFALATPYVVARIAFVVIRWCRLLLSTTFCGACGYNLTGNVSGICPECGTRTQQAIGYAHGTRERST